MNLQEQKNIYLNSGVRMNPELENQIKSNSLDLAKNPAFPKTDASGNQINFLELIAYKRFNDVVSLVKRYNPQINPASIGQVSSVLMGAVRTITNAEQPHIPKLEKLAVDVVVNEMEIPDGAFLYDAKIVPVGSISGEGFILEGKKQNQQEVQSQFGEQAEVENMTASELFEMEKHKRRFINMLIQGASKKGHYMFQLVAGELNEINPQMTNEYGKMMSANDIIYWLFPDETIKQMASQPSNMAGKEEIEDETDPPTLKVRGINFPVVVHELVKAIMDVFGTQGLPDDPKSSQMIIDSVDSLENETMDLRVGVPVWELFSSSYPAMVFAEGNRHIQHYLFARFCALEINEFFRVARLILSQSQEGSKYMERMANEIVKDLENQDYNTQFGDDTGYSLDDILGYRKGGSVEKGYNVFNYTDNVYASDEVFKTKKLANNFIKEFRNRYSKQGYYRDNQMNKIAVEDIDLLAIPSDFNPFGKYEDGGEMQEEKFRYKDIYQSQGGIKFKTKEEAERFIKTTKPFVRKQLREGNFVLVFNGKEYFIGEKIKINDEYADGGEVMVNGLTKQDYIDAYLKRVDSVIENLKQKGEYDSEDFDLLGEVDKEGGFTEIEDVGHWLNWAEIKGDYEALIEIFGTADYTEYSTYQFDTLAHFFFGKPIKINLYINSSGDSEYDYNTELQKIKLLLNKIDFDRITGEINYEEMQNNTNLKFYKNGTLVMSLNGDWNEETEELDAIIDIDGETTELNYHPLDSMGGVSMEQLEKNINEAFRELNTYSAVVSIEGYEEYAEDVEGLENAKALIQDIKGNTRFQVLKGSSVGIGKRVDDSRVIEEFAKGGKAGKDIYDYDEEMALINLDEIYEYAIKIDKMIDEDTDLEEWVKMKLTRIEQSISDVKHSLEGWEKYKNGGEIPKKQLLHIAKYSKELIKMIQGGSRLMSWQEDKLAISSASIDDIYHHLDYKMGNRAEDLDIENKEGILYKRGGMTKNQLISSIKKEMLDYGFDLTDEQISDYIQIKNLQMFETNEREEYLDFIAKNITGMSFPKYGDTTSYKQNFYQKLRKNAKNKGYNFSGEDEYAGGGKTTQKYVVIGNVYDGGEVWKETFDNLDEAVDLAREIENGWTDDGTYYLITIYNETGKKVAEISTDKYFHRLTDNKLFKKFDFDVDTKKERQSENEKLKGYKFKLEVRIADGGATVIYEKTFDSIFDVMDKMNKYYEEDYYALINGERLDYWQDKMYEIDELRNYIKGKYGWSFIKEGNLWIAKDDYEDNHIVRIVNGKLESNDSAVTKGALKQIAELESQKKYSEKPKHNKSLSAMKKIWDGLNKNYNEREDIAFLLGYYGGLLEQIVPKKWNDIEKGTQIRIMNAYFGQTEEQKQKIINEYRKRHESLVKEHKTLRNLYGLDKKGKELFGVKKYAGGGETTLQDGVYDVKDRYTLTLKNEGGDNWHITIVDNVRKATKIDKVVPKHIAILESLKIGKIFRSSDDNYAGGGEIEDWMQSALYQLQAEEDNDNLQISFVKNNEFTCQDDDANEYRVFKNEDVAEEMAVEEVREDIEYQPEMFNRDFLMDFVDVDDFLVLDIENANYDYVKDIEDESYDDKYANRLIAELVEYGLISENEALTTDPTELSDEFSQDYINLLTSEQIGDDNGVEYFIDNFGEDEFFKIVIDNNLIDFDNASKDAVNMDGIAHFLARYDGETIYLDNNVVAYRTN
jgi:hypothetical protein